MYPRNAASPERIAVGAVVTIADGSVVTSGATVSVTKQGGSETGSAGTIAYSTGGIVFYTPTQAETDATSFIVTAYKASCIPASILVVTSASATPGTVNLAAVQSITSVTLSGAFSVGSIVNGGVYTQTGATTYTGLVTISNGMTVTGGAQGDALRLTATTAGAGLAAAGKGTGSGISAAGEGGGTGHGILATSGSGATGDGIHAVSAASAGNGMYLLGTTTGNGLLSTGGAGAGGDGIEAVAGGGVPIRGDMTGNITGTITTATNLTNERSKYMHGAVWLGAAGNTNTTNYVDGIMTNPVSTIAAAKSIADNLGLKRFWVQSGVTVTLGAAYVSYVFTGAGGYILALGGQDISKSVIENVETLSGTAICTTGEAIIRNCHLGPTAITIGEVDFHDCHLMGTITMSQATVPYLFNKCVGVSAAKIVFNAANQSAVISKWSGPLTIAGMVSTNTLYIDGDGDVTFDNTNNTGTVNMSGNIRLTNSGTSMAITDTSRWGEDQTIAVATAVTTVNGLAANVITAASMNADASTEIATTLLATAIDGTTTWAESVRLANSALGGKASGLNTTTAVYRDLADSKDRITATVDADGNRSAVSRTLT